MKVLLFSNDLMPFGELPTSGGGLRCWQLMQGLQAHGIEVFASMPGFTYLAEQHYAKIPEPQRELLWRWDTQDELVRRIKPDAILYASNWDHFNLTRKPDVPLVIDLHGSRLIETTMWNNPVSTDRKVEIFSKADCFLTAGQRQRSYFYGWLLQAGRVPDDEHFIRYIPISLGPDAPVKEPLAADDSGFPHFVSGGGWFPWQNQAKAVFALCNAITARDRGSISIFGTPHETAHCSPEERVIRDIYAEVCRLAAASPRIQAGGYVGRNELIEKYRKASVAVELMRFNLERELAFTTRTIEYLWCGLPVLYNNYAEISDHIREYDAGWTIDPESDEEIARTIDEIFSNPALVTKKGENAQRLVRDRFSWDKTILPLVDFLRAPKRAARSEPAVGTVIVRPSFLSPRGSTAEIALSASRTALTQKVIVPAENIAAIDIPVTHASGAAGSTNAGGTVSIQVRDSRRRIRARAKYAISALPANGMVTVKFPRLFRPTGGEHLEVELRVRTSGAKGADRSQPVLFARGLLAPSYPFVEKGLSAVAGAKDAMSEQGEVEGVGMLAGPVMVRALAVNFIPGGARIYRLKLLAARGVEMIRRGEWGRLRRALVTRFRLFLAQVRVRLSGIFARA